MARILLVEDDETNLDMLSRRLLKRGFDVLFARDGVEACASAEREMPDLILMDMQMPVLDGYAATRRIKTSALTRAIPVIGLSSHAMAEHQDLAMAAGCDDYDTKPVDLNRLLGKIKLLLQQRESA